MASRHHRDDRSRPGLSFILLLLLLVALWIAGGSSRGDVPGQLVVRTASWLLLCALALFGDALERRRALPVAILLFSTLALILLQLVPLPPDLWQALPGREIIAQAADEAGMAQPWRPWSMVPAATLNAAFAMIIPIATFVLAIGMTRSDARRMPGVILCLVGASAGVGTLEFSGVGFDNVLANDAQGFVSGMFANRNHFALFTALGCLIAPVWAVQGGGAHWRGPVALGLILLFALIVLASGSRAGLLVAALGLGVGLLLARTGIKKELARAPRWAFPLLIVIIVAAVAAIVLLSISADRALSIDRLGANDPGQDMRRRALPTVMEMIRTYFPAGAGIGAFDPIFRMHEPFVLLKPTYFNHAHNDFLEIVIDAGLPGLLLLIAGLLWWGWASVAAWRARDAGLARLGSAMLLLIVVASVFDYPGRTPIVMAIAVLAAVWLADYGARPGGQALPTRNDHL